jgi:hypothetical protein
VLLRFSQKKADTIDDHLKRIEVEGKVSFGGGLTGV